MFFVSLPVTCLPPTTLTIPSTRSLAHCCRYHCWMFSCITGRVPINSLLMGRPNSFLFNLLFCVCCSSLVSPDSFPPFFFPWGIISSLPLFSGVEAMLYTSYVSCCLFSISLSFLLSHVHNPTQIEHTKK